MDNAAARFDLYDIDAMRPEAVQMADLILQATKELEELFAHFSFDERSHLLDMGCNSLVVAHLAMKQCCQRLLRDIVFRGAQTTCNDDNL